MLIERRVKILNINGLHARPATRFAEMANKFNSDIFVRTEKKEEVNGKSIIDLLTLGAKRGTDILITANGEDKEIALDVLEGLVSDRFNEDNMETRKGIAVAPGVVIKEAFVLESEGYRIPRHLIKEDEVDKEISRLEEASYRTIPAPACSVSPKPLEFRFRAASRVANPDVDYVYHETRRSRVDRCRRHSALFRLQRFRVRFRIGYRDSDGKV